MRTKNVLRLVELKQQQQQQQQQQQRRNGTIKRVGRREVWEGERVRKRMCVDVKECVRGCERVCVGVGECERDCVGVRRRAGEKRTNLINERFFSSSS